MISADDKVDDAQLLRLIAHHADKASQYRMTGENHAQFHEMRESALRELRQLRAQGLSQEDREACLAGAESMRYRGNEQYTMSQRQEYAAILRRLGGQTT